MRTAPFGRAIPLALTVLVVAFFAAVPTEANARADASISTVAAASRA